MTQSPPEKITSVSIRKWRDEVLGIALFGSFVRGREFRDIDVLIVLEKIDKSRIERIKDIIEIKRSLDFPADILLISREECIDNFKNHNPLFLDIAAEGRVIYDTGFLKKLIDETRHEIKEKNIKKKSSGWVFPVKDRMPTPLSELTNRDWANYWLQDSERDLDAADYLMRIDLYDKAAYHCQQSVEKAVKAILICFGAYERTHYVANVLRKEVGKRNLKKYSRELDEIIEIAEELEPHVSLSRYPGFSGGEVWLPSKEYTKDAVEGLFRDTRKALRIGNGFVKWWFENGD
ncbi:MAG TPA: HEPN domain-containing protein [Candidatus Methanoperedens sp.]